MQKKGDLYYPSEEFKKSARVDDEKIYKEAEKDPVKFWDGLAKDLFWHKPWQKTFEHTPPYFKWFLEGKINITANVFEKNPLGWEEIKNKVALIWEPEPINEEPRKITYGELFKEVCKLANAFKKLGVKKGDRVGIYLPMIPEAITSMLACARIGAVHTVIFSAFSPPALKIRLKDTGAKILITADGYFRRGKIINLKESADEGIKETDVEKVIVIKRLNIKIPWNPKKDIWHEDFKKEESENCEAEAIDSEDPLFILTESGTTGEYLQILHAIGGYTVQANFTGKWVFDFHNDSILWCTADFGWITGHTYGVYSPLLNGITSIIYEGAPDFPTPDRWASIIEKYGVTIFYTAPTAIRMFEKYGTEIIKKYKFETLKILGSVGEPIDDAAWNWYFKEIGKEKCPVVDTWWQTETGGIIISSLPGIGPFKPAFVGLPLPGIKVDILDEKGYSCKTGEPGNLVILPPFCPGLLRGIYNDERKYLNTYWKKYGKEIYFTSDGALKDENGLIRIIGRIDDVIKVAGHRISIPELESAMNSVPGVVESAAIAIDDEIKGKVPVAFVIYKGKKEKETAKKEIGEKVKKEIGPIAFFKEIYLVEDVPRTTAGKIMRKLLKNLFTGEELGDLSALTNPEIVEKIKKILGR